MKNILKRATALLLSLLMVFSVCSTSLIIYATNSSGTMGIPEIPEKNSYDTNNDGVVNIVTFGASNVNGFGLDGYLPEEVYENPWQKDEFNIYGYKRVPAGSYPDLLVNYLEEKGYTVEIDQLAMSSMRAEEVRFMFDETYVGDAYTDWRFYDVPGIDGTDNSQDWFEGAGKEAYKELQALYPEVYTKDVTEVTEPELIAALRKVYQRDTANADIVIWDVGINNFGVYLSNRVVSGDYDETIEEIDPEIAAEYYALKDELFATIEAEYGSEMMETLKANNADYIMDAMAYCLVSYCINYDIAMEEIYKLNSDVTVINVTIQNLMKGLFASIPGIGEFPLGDVVALAINAANTYMGYASPFAEKGYYANVSENQHVTYFIDQLAEYNGDPTTLDEDMINCWRVYNGGNMLQSLEPFVFDRNGKLTYDTNVTGSSETLYYMQLVAIDAVAKYMKAGGALNVIYFSSLVGGDFNKVSNAGMNAIAGAVGEELGKFGEHMAKGGTYDNFPLTEVSDTFWDELAVANDIDQKLMATFAAYGVRTFIGNAFYAHPNRVGHVEIFEIVRDAFEKKITGPQVVGANADEVLQDFYNFLSDPNSMSTPEKVELLYTVYSIIKGKTSLKDNPEVIVAEAIYSELSTKGYINDDQTLAIVLCAYACMLDDKTIDDGEILAIVSNVYESILLNKELSDADRIDIIFTVYGILNDAYKLGSTFTTFANIAKKLVIEDESITPLQAFAVVHFVYLAYANDGVIDANEYRVIANLIYYVIFGVPKAKMGRSGFDWSTFKIEDLATMEGGLAGLLEKVQEDVAASDEKTATEKIAIINTVYTELKKDETIIQPGSQIEAVGDLFVTLTKEDEKGETLLDPAATEKILSTAFSTLVTPDPENVDIENAVKEITKTVTEELVNMEPEKFEEVMGEINKTLDKVGGTESGEGGSVIPSIPTIPTVEIKLAKSLVEELKAEDLLTGEQASELVGALMSVLMGGELNPTKLVDDVYAIVYKEGFDIVKTVKIVIVVTTFAYENELIQNAANPYYADAMAAVLTAENIEIALGAISTAKTALNDAIVALGGQPRAAIESDTTALKEALRAELEAAYDTLVEIENVLNNLDQLKVEDEYQIQATIAVLLTFEEDLYAHANNIAAIATEAGIFAMPYIQYALAEINKYVDLAAEKAQDAYNWCVANVQQFAADYLALVETIGAEVDKIDPALGAAVRKFMIEAPADTLYILYVYGEDAVNELIDRALVYGDAVATAAVELARVLNKYGVTIYNAIMESGACQDLYDELLGVVDQILALEEQIKKPSDIEDVALDIYSKLDKLQAYAIDLAGRFYNAAIAAVKADDYLAGEELCNAINALVAALATIDDEAIDYAEWLGEHATEMGGALLTAFLANWDELYEVAAPIIIREAKNIYNQVKDYILNYDYEALIQQIIDAAIKFAPELDEYLYNYFYNNPEEVIAFFEEYGPEIVYLSVKYGPYALGVIGVALATYGPELADYIINNPEAVLAGLSAWADKYGDRVVAILQVYAEALGICDAVRNEIEDLKADLAALQAQLAVLNEQLKTAAGEVRDAIEAEIARVQAEIAKVQAKIAELQQKLQNLVNAIYNLNDALKKFATEAIEFATAAVVTAIANLENAVKELLDSVSDDVADKLRDLIKTGVGLTIDLIADLAKLAVDAAIKFAPELDEYLYNYFYNNPEEVIAFFNEYGDEIIELCKRYGDKALGIIAIALAYAGPELAEYIINNPKEVLEGLSAWADKYGAKIVAILQVYAEALGLCDAVRGEVAELNNKLAALQAELMNQLNILQNELQAELDALYAQLENATEAAKVIILEKIKEIESKIELVQKYIAELQAKIAELQVKIAEINAKLQALIDALYNLDDALKALLETGVEAGVAAVQKALNEVVNAVRDVIGVISDDIAAQIDKLLQKAKDYLNDAYHSAIIADYVINSNSSYVALGDNEEYAKLFAQYLKDTVAAENVGYNYKVNTALVQNGSKISTLPVIINENLGTIAAADLISIGYSFDKVAEDTILMAIELLMDGKTSVPTDYDWATIVGAEAAAEIEKLVGEIYTYMLNEGLGITVSEATSGMFDHNVTIADIAIIAVQYFVYNVVEYAAYLPQAVNAISQINPDAIIMINSISNPISGAKVSFFGEEIVFGDYLDYVCDAMLVETAVLAAIYENVVFVPTTEIETTFTNRTISFNSSKDFIALAELLTALMENQAINTTPNGNAYACQKMTEALNITVEDGGLLGDVNGDGVVDYIDAILILRYEVGFVDPKFIAGVADVDRDGYIGYVDAIWVLKYEAGLEKEFPASK